MFYFDLFKSRKAYPVGTIRGDYVKIKDAPKHLWVPKSDPRAKKFLERGKNRDVSKEEAKRIALSKTLKEKQKQLETKEKLESEREKDYKPLHEVNDMIDFVFEGKWKTGTIAYIVSDNAYVLTPENDDIYRIWRGGIFKPSKKFSSKEKKELKKRSIEVRKDFRKRIKDN